MRVVSQLLFHLWFQSGFPFVIFKADHVKSLPFNSQTAFLLTLYEISVVMRSGFVTVGLIFLKFVDRYRQIIDNS